MNKFEIRLAEKKDVKGILEIYKPFILETEVTFEEIVPTEEEFWQRIQDIIKECPFLVCSIDDQIAGYAYASDHRKRASYRWTKEVSVYVHPDFRRKNIAKALYFSLIEVVRIQGVCNLLAGITLPNEASVRFHESMGFTKCAEYKNIGYKLDKWQTVGWWELNLTDGENKPVKNIVPLDGVLLESVFNKAIQKGLIQIKR